MPETDLLCPGCQSPSIAGDNGRGVYCHFCMTAITAMEHQLTVLGRRNAWALFIGLTLDQAQSRYRDEMLELGVAVEPLTVQRPVLITRPVLKTERWFLVTVTNIDNSTILPWDERIFAADHNQAERFARRQISDSGHSHRDGRLTYKIRLDPDQVEEMK